MVLTGCGDVFGSSAAAFNVNATTVISALCMMFMTILSVSLTIYACEITGECRDLGIIQALCNRAHRLAGVVFSRAVLEGLERAREVFRRLSGQIGRGLRDTHAVRTMTAIACLNPLGFIALVRQLMATCEIRGVL